jgi:hypothetical protein
VKKFFAILFLFLGFLFLQSKPALGISTPPPPCSGTDNEIYCGKECEKFLTDNNYYESQNSGIVCQTQRHIIKPTLNVLMLLTDPYALFIIVLLILPILVFIIHCRRHFKLYKLIYLIFPYFQIILSVMVVNAVWPILNQPFHEIINSSTPSAFYKSIDLLILIFTIILLASNFLTLKYIFKIKSVVKYNILLTIWVSFSIYLLLLFKMPLYN